MHPLAQQAASLLDTDITGVTPLHGGDLSEVLRLTRQDGTTVVVKSGPAPQTEAAMLGTIADTGAPAPAVLACSATALVLKDMPETGTLTAAAWADLATHLKRLNACTGPRYGWNRDYAFGPVPIANDWRDTWPDFWRDNRLLPALPHLPTPLATQIEQTARTLPDLLPATPPASLLHGDLWTGNIMANHDTISALIDPACHYGHGEVDLAMLSLFDQPPAPFWDTYGQPTGNWPQRRAIYQLWPALVHLRLFGSGYLPLIGRLIAQIPA